MVLWPSGDYSPKLTTTPGYYRSDAIPTEARMKLRRPQRTGWGRRLSVGLTAAVVAPMILVAFAGTAQAAKSAGCENGGFSLKTLPGTVPAATFVTATANTVTTTCPAGKLGARFRVQGRYTQFDINSSDFAVYDQA